MKMTKAIREFIEEQVTERAESASNTRLTELHDAAELAKANWNNALETARIAFNSQLAEMAQQFGYDYKAYDGKTYQPNISFSCTDCRYLPEVKAYNEYKAELNNKRNRAIKDIIVSMELGGTKKELMEMIAALEF